MGSRDVEFFWELLEKENSVLSLDNDMCFVNVVDGFTEYSETFDFTQQEIIFLFCEKMGIEAEMV